MTNQIYSNIYLSIDIHNVKIKFRAPGGSHGARILSSRQLSGRCLRGQGRGWRFKHPNHRIAEALPSGWTRNATHRGVGPHVPSFLEGTGCCLRHGGMPGRARRPGRKALPSTRKRSYGVTLKVLSPGRRFQVNSSIAYPKNRVKFRYAENKKLAQLSQFLMTSNGYYTKLSFFPPKLPSLAWNNIYGSL